MDKGRQPLRMRFECLPPRRTAQQKGACIRNGHVMFFTKKEVRREEQTMTALVLSRLPPGWVPFEGAVDLYVRLCYPYRNAEPKRVRDSGIEIPHDRRPDLDNICKSLFDALSAAQVFRDDSQLARIRAEKCWGPTAYWEFEASKAKARRWREEEPREGVLDIVRLLRDGANAARAVKAAWTTDPDELADRIEAAYLHDPCIDMADD